MSWSRTLAKRRAPLNFAVTDTARTPDPAAMAERLPAGSIVLFRHYDSPDRARLGEALATVARRRRLTLLVAADHRLADTLRADGLHLPEGLARRGLLAAPLLWLRRRGGVLTAAAHSPAALARAARLGAHAALLSPVFPTRSHPGAKTLGPWRFSLWAGEARLPVVALGGATRQSVRRLGNAAGIAGVPQACLDRPARSSTAHTPVRGHR